MYSYDSALDNDTMANSTEEESDKENDPIDASPWETFSTSPTTISSKKPSIDCLRFLASFIHMVTFCHLCSKRKIPAITPMTLFPMILIPALTIKSPVQANISWRLFLKINDNMDKQSLHFHQEHDEKEPGCTRLESYWKNLLLNASALPPFDSPANAQSEFYSLFLSKNSHFKTKEVLSHRLLLVKISFNPAAAFITFLWHA